MERSALLKCIPLKKAVKYDGSLYLPIAYRLTFNDKNKEWRHSCELLDIKSSAKSIVVAPLERIELN